jgi:PhoPQ-activated pathogenicity-related protein
VKCIDKPSEIKLWQATNAEKRDFRLASIGAAYKSSDVIDRGDGSYEAKLKNPEKGWTASFVELTYPSGGKYPFKFTTAVRVSPDTLPYPLPKRSGKLPE